MVRRYAAVLRLTLVAADIGLALLVVAGGYSFRFGPTFGGTENVSTSQPDPNLIVAVFVGMWIAVLWMHGLYRARERWTRRGEIAAVLRATLVQLALTLSALYVFKLPDVSRLLLLVVFPALTIAAIGIRIGIRQILVFLRDHGRNVRFMLVLGANARAKAFADLVECHAELGLVVIGHLKADPSDNGVVLNRPLLGMLEDLEEILHSKIVDEVAICLPFAMEELIEQAVYLCEQEGKVVRMPVAPVERMLTAGRLESIDGVGVYSMANGPDRAIGLMAKRLVDIVAAAFLMVAVSPVMAALAIAIKRDSKGPVFFRQERVGLHGRVFKLVKFRSMCVDAEDQLEDLRHGNEINGHAFKLNNDPRTTGVGRFLRRSSLDELPQLLNVLRGQMSLVGPRPPLPSEVERYERDVHRRLMVKPGMTGLWQVSGRSDLDWEETVRLDLYYVENWSAALDGEILWKTFSAVLR